MTNVRFYLDELEEIWKDDPTGLFGLKNGKPVGCDYIACVQCQFFASDKDCAEDVLDWMFREDDE